MSPTLDLQLGIVGHALNREANSSDVETSIQNSLANNFHQLLESSSDPVGCLFVKELITSRWICIWAPIFSRLW